MFSFPYVDGLTNVVTFVEARHSGVEDSGQLWIWVFEIITQLNLSGLF